MKNAITISLVFLLMLGSGAHVRADWIHQAPLPTTSELHGVHMITPTEGWAVGGDGIFGGDEGGVILHTIDGGITWTEQFRPADTPLTNATSKDVDFVDASYGWAVGGNGAILHTTDGGLSWVLQPSGTNAFLDGVSFINRNEGWAAGGETFLHTTDGGATWQKQNPHPVPGPTA